MFNRVLLFILFLPVLAVAETQYSAFADAQFVVKSNWDSTAGSTKITSLSDANDATYIWTTTNETDTFEVNIPTAMEWDDELDSLKLFWRAKRQLTGTAEVTAKLHSGADVLTGTTRSLTTTLTDYTETFNSVTGFSYGDASWRLSFTTTNMASDTAKVVVCSVGVYFTRRPIFYFTSVAGCSTGANFGEVMQRFNPGRLDTHKVVVPANTTENDFFSTEAYIPYNNNWETGGATVYLNLIKNVNPCSVEVRIIRTDSFCVWADSSSFSTKQTLSGLGPQIQQTIDPSPGPSPNQWDSTSGQSKITSLTDASDPDYIYSPLNTIDTDIYILQDFNLSNYEVDDRIDSFVVYVRAQKSGVPAASFTPAIIIGADTTAGSSVGLTTSWAGYSRTFSSPPGSRGTWDTWEIDSTKLRFHTGDIHGECRITNCSTVVYVTKQNTSIAIPSKTWGSVNIKSRMQVHFKWTNPAGAAEDTIWFRVGSNSLSRLEHEVSNQYESGFLSQLPQFNCASTLDTILPAAEAVAPNSTQWLNFGGANKVASITDANQTGTFIMSTNGTQAVQRFSVGNTGLPSDYTIDTVEMRAESREFDTSPNSNNRYLFRAYLGTLSSSNYCNFSGLFSQTSSWTFYTGKQGLAPSTAGTCGNPWSVARLDSIEVEYRVSTIGTNDTIAVTYADVIFCYAASGGQSPKRRRKVQMIGGVKDSLYQEFVKELGLREQNDPVIGFADSRAWLWTDRKDVGLRNPEWVLKWEE